jgi:flagellar motor protein MotB
MSKMYDDLKRKTSSGNRPVSGDELDLFSYAQRRRESAAPDVPPRIVESLPPSPPPQPEVSETAADVRRGLERNAPLIGVLEPLSRLPPLGKPDIRWRRYAAAALGLLAVAAALAYLLHACRRPASATAQPRVETNAPTAAAAAAARPTEPPPRIAPVPKAVPASAPVGQERPISQSAQLATSSGAPLSGWRAPNARVTHAAKAHVVQFDDGVFLGATRIKPQAAQALRSLAKQLAPYGRRARITVIGCTDNTPLNPGSRFRDNTELGLARAREVVDFLKAAGPLPAAEFEVLSYGERWVPYPNTTPEGRAKNRTVVLRISIKD